MSPLADFPTFFIWVIYLLVGLCMGSFASAMSYRISTCDSWIVTRHHGQSKPARSACPSCGHSLTKFDLIPLFSWLFLGGKCRYCRTDIPARYPLIELTGAVLMGSFTLLIPHIAFITLFALTLPFLLAFILLWQQKATAPIYVYALVFSNIFIWILAILYARGIF